MRTTPTIVAVLAGAAITLNAQSLADDLALLDVTGRPRDPRTNATVVAPPPGAKISPGSTGTSPFSYESHARLETGLALTAIADHYTKYVAGSRWKLEARREDGDVIAAARFAGTNAASESITALLTIARLTPTRVDVAVRIFRRTPAQTPPPPRSPLPADDRAAALVLLRAPSSAAVQDAAPDGFPSDVLPAGAKVIAVASVPPAQTFLIAVAPAFDATQFAPHLQRLVDAGWIDEVGFLGGFRNPRGLGTQLCHGQQEVDVLLTPRDAGGSYLMVHTGPPGCRPSRDLPLRDTALPVLLPPPGVWSHGSGVGVGVDSQHFGTQLVGRERLAPVAAHFLDQMTKSGWPTVARIADDVMSVSLHRSKTSRGDAVTAVLSVADVSEAGMLDAWLRIIRNNPQK